MENSDISTVTHFIMNDELKALHFSYDHFMKRLDFVCDNIGVSHRGSFVCDVEVSDKFGKMMDHFGFQDGETHTLSSNHLIIKEFINLIMDKFRESCF
jgi:hypothetical protein